MTDEMKELLGIQETDPAGGALERQREPTADDLAQLVDLVLDLPDDQFARWLKQPEKTDA